MPPVPLRLLLFTAVTLVSCQSGPMTNAPGNFMSAPSLYELLQRQNQLNNAILLNHALISNQMAAGLQDNHLHTPPTFPPFPQQAANIPPLALYPQQIQGLLPQNSQRREKLGIYEALSPMAQPKSAEVVSSRIPHVVSGVVPFKVKAVATESSEEKVYKLIQAVINQFHDLEHSKTLLKIKAIGKTIWVTTTETALTTTHEQRPSKITNALTILKNLNLTETDSEKLVQLVEQVVREELAKKLSDAAKLSAVTVPYTTSTKNIATASTTQATTTTETVTNIEEEKTSEEDATPSEAEEPIQEFAGPFTPGPIDRSERLLEEEIPEIKLHPPKRTEEKDDSYSSIKTSETHLTAIERAAEEEEKEREAARKRYNKVTVSLPPSSTQSPTGSSTQSSPLTTTEEFDPKKPRRTFIETDSDLLALATGAPLDLSDETTSDEVSYRNRFRATRAPVIPRRVSKPPMPPRLRPSTPPSQFVRLAADYRERLAGTEDVTKLLQNFYENAYIQLVASEVDARKIPKPREVQLSPGRS